jgi:protein arginine kinase
LSKRRGETEDQAFRALGTLRHARLVATEESMQLLSMVRMGVVAGIIEGVDVRRVNECMLLTQPAHLQRLAGQEIDQDGRRHLRATMLRDRLREAK